MDHPRVGEADRWAALVALWVSTLSITAYCAYPAIAPSGLVSFVNLIRYPKSG